MKLLLGTAVLLAALTPVVAAPPSPAREDADINPPDVGSCHTLTADQAYDETDPEPPVPCTEAHTSVTTKILAVDANADWGSDAFLYRTGKRCQRATIAYFDDRVKSLQMSNYFTWFFYPTPFQRESGASWVRCDVILYAAWELKPLPTDGGPELGPLPLEEGIARCAKSKVDDYLVTTCDRPHRFRAVRALKYPDETYPGARRIERWTLRKCDEKLGPRLGYYHPPSRRGWDAGLRYSICYKTTG